jgi:predicted ester cyclase
MRIDIAGYRSAFPDLRMTTEDLVADGDRIARRFRIEGTHAGAFMGIPPSGQRVALGGIAIHRVAEGRLVETWLSYDCLGLLRQLGSDDPGASADGNAAD